jgi:hypothetical protein
VSAPEKRKTHVRLAWNDPLLPNEKLTLDGSIACDAASTYCQEKPMPRMVEAFRHERTDKDPFHEMGAPGLLGRIMPEQFRGRRPNFVSGGVIAQEVERVNSGYRLPMERTIPPRPIKWRPRKCLSLVPSACEAARIGPSVVSHVADGEEEGHATKLYLQQLKFPVIDALFTRMER